MSYEDLDKAQAECVAKDAKKVAKKVSRNSPPRAREDAGGSTRVWKKQVRQSERSRLRG